MAKKNLESDSSSSSGDESLPPPTTTGMKPTVDSGSESESDDFERPLRSIVSKQAEDGSKAKMPRSKANSKQAEDGSKAKRLRSKADSKQAEDGSEAKKPRSKADSKPSSSPSPTKMPAKRPTAAAGEKNPKKSKTVKASEAEEGKKSVLFQRLWSDDDEVAILKGMLEYKEQKGSDPMEDTNGFYEFVKSSVHCNMERRQLVDKVRRLKKRLENTKTRKTFSPHEMIVIELCKKVWGQKLDSNTNITSKASKNAASLQPPRVPRMLNWKNLRLSKTVLALLKRNRKQGSLVREMIL